LNGDDIADADFWLISVAYAIICFLCLYSVVFILYAGRKRVEQLEMAQQLTPKSKYSQQSDHWEQLDSRTE